MGGCALGGYPKGDYSTYFGRLDYISPLMRNDPRGHRSVCYRELYFW